MLGGSVLTLSHPAKLISSSHASQPRSANLSGLKLFWEKQQKQGEWQQTKRWEKVRLKLWATPAAYHCCHQYAATDENTRCYSARAPFVIVHATLISTSKKKVLLDVLVKFLNISSLGLSLSPCCHCYGSNSRIYNDAEWLIIHINRACASSASIINLINQINCSVIRNHMFTLLIEAIHINHTAKCVHWLVEMHIQQTRNAV